MIALSFLPFCTLFFQKIQKNASGGLIMSLYIFWYSLLHKIYLLKITTTKSDHHLHFFFFLNFWEKSQRKIKRTKWKELICIFFIIIDNLINTKYSIHFSRLHVFSSLPESPWPQLTQQLMHQLTLKLTTEVITVVMEVTVVMVVTATVVTMAGKGEALNLTKNPK